MATRKRSSVASSSRKRNKMENAVDNIVSTRIMAPPLVGRESNIPKKVQFRCFDTIHIFGDKSTVAPLFVTEDCKSQGVEIEKPKTSEYQYFKRMKPSNNKNQDCFIKLKSQKELKRSEFNEHDSRQELGTGNLMENHVNATNGKHHETQISPILEGQSLEVEIKEKKGTHNICRMVFQIKRQKLQELAAKALGVKREKLILFGSKIIAMLLQRLDSHNNKRIGGATQKKRLKSHKSRSGGLRKRAFQSNFQAETFSDSLDLKNDFQKACTPLDMLDDVERPGHVSCRNKLLNKGNSNLQQDGHCSLFLPLKVDGVHPHGNNACQNRLHGMSLLCDTEDVDFGTDSESNSWKLAQDIDVGPEMLHDGRSLHFPHSLIPKSAFFDGDHTWLSEDFPFSPGTPQSSRYHAFDLLPLKSVGLGLRQWSKINHKSDNTYFTKESSMLLLDNEDIINHCRQEFIPETDTILQGSPNKHIFFNLKCDRTENFSLGGTLRHFDLTVAPRDDDHEIVVPDLGFCLSTIQLQDLIDNWEPRESLSHCLFTDIDFSQGQHKMIDSTDVVSCMTSNDKYIFAQEPNWKTERLFYNFPAIGRPLTNYPVRCLEHENLLDVQDHDLAGDNEWESFLMSICPGIEEKETHSSDSVSDFSGEYLGLIPYTNLSYKSVFQSNREEVMEFGDLNSKLCADTANHVSFFR